MLITSIGIVLVCHPELTQIMATWAGIGRGVDIIIYLFLAIMTLVILDVYIRLHSTNELLTKMVRNIALLEATLEKKKKKKSN